MVIFHWIVRSPYTLILKFAVDASHDAYMLNHITVPSDCQSAPPVTLQSCMSFTISVQQIDFYFLSADTDIGTQKDTDISR